MISAAEARELYIKDHAQKVATLTIKKVEVLKQLEQDVNFAIANSRQRFLCKVMPEYCGCMDMVIGELESLGYKVDCRREKRPNAPFELTISFEGK